MYTVMQVLSEAVNQSSFSLWERSPQNVIRWKVKWDIFNKKNTNRWFVCEKSKEKSTDGSTVHCLCIKLVKC